VQGDFVGQGLLCKLCWQPGMQINAEHNLSMHNAGAACSQACRLLTVAQLQSQPASAACQQSRLDGHALLVHRQIAYVSLVFRGSWAAATFQQQTSCWSSLDSPLSTGRLMICEQAVRLTAW
jgi:hypothetical protein